MKKEVIDIEAGKTSGYHDKTTTEMENKSHSSTEAVKIFAVVAFYFVISILTVFLNKFVMSYSHHNFNFPIAMTWFQMVFALLCIVLTYPLNKIVPWLYFLPDLEFKWKIAKQIWPLTLIYVLMLAFNNVCLLYVDVAFYQVARSLSIVCTVVFTYVMLGEKVSLHALLAIGGVLAGYVIGAIGGYWDKQFLLGEKETFNTSQSIDMEQELSFSQRYSVIIGLIFGFLSSLFVALYGIYVKKKLPVVGDNAWILLIYNTVIAIVFLLPMIVIFQEQNVIFLDYLTDFSFWTGMSITALAGYLINIALFLQIGYTSPLSNTISGTAKACVQTLLGFIIFKEYASLVTLFGTLLCIVASTAYTRVKYVEMEEKKLSQQSIKTMKSGDSDENK